MGRGPTGEVVESEPRKKAPATEATRSTTTATPSAPDVLRRAHAQARADRAATPAGEAIARVVAALTARAPANSVEVVQRAPGRVIQRYPGSGFYLVCGKNDKDATVVEDDPLKPARYYRTVPSLPTGAVAAPSQPFRLWYLYEVPTAQPTVTAKSTAPEKTTTATPTDKQVEGNKPATGKPQETKAAGGNGSTTVVPTAASTKTNNKKKKGSEQPVVDQKQGTKTAEPSFEDRWKANVRKLATEQGMQRPEIDTLIKDFAEKLDRYPKELETALTELAAAWQPEFVSGLETDTLEQRQQYFRSRMPAWDGTASKIQSVLNGMSDVVDSARKSVLLLKQAGTIRTAVGAACFTDLLTQWNLFQAMGYADAIGHERLRVLMVDRRLTATVLKHYGHEGLKGFRGAGFQVWLHLTEAKLNSKLDVSGAHDDFSFREFISRPSVKYAIVNDPFPAARVVRSLIPKPTSVGEVPQVAPVLPPRGHVYTVQYTEGDDQGNPRPNGAVAYKTLINGLVNDQNAWMARFDEAIWQAIAAMTFPMKAGGLFFGTDGAGQQYKGYYTKGNEVDTLFPFI